METFPSDSALKNLAIELRHGRELARQLQLHQNAQSSSKETLVYLLNEILNTYDRALWVIEYGGRVGGGAPPKISDSPGPALIESPRTSHSDQACRMRGYYRGTHGKSCLARKHIQRSDEDPTTFDVTYKGLHTCSSNPPIPFPIIRPQNELKTASTFHENRINQSQQEPFLDIQTSLKIMDTSNDKQCNITSSSNFNPENDPIFPDDNLPWEDYLLDFMNPTAPELNNFNDYEPPTQDVDSSFDSSSGQLGSSFGFGNSSYFP